MLASQGLLKRKIALSDIQILELHRFSPNMLDWHSGESQLFWVRIESPDKLFEFIDDKCQTLSFFGVDKNQLASLVEQSHSNSIDRVVLLGRALDFDLVWDGCDLFSQLTRQVQLLI